MDNKELADMSGLADGGKNELGQQLWIGTDEQWDLFEKLKKALVASALDRIEVKLDKILDALPK